MHTTMKHERHHWLERKQVELAGVAALAVTYFVLGPMHGWWDPQWPATFISTGSFFGLLQFAVLVWVLAAACAAVTSSSRPEGALFTTLIGAAGVSMHSTPIRVLFWSSESSISTVFVQLAIELLAFIAVVVVAIHIICRVRAAMAKLFPAWMWKGRIMEAFGDSDEPSNKSDKLTRPKRTTSWFLWVISPIGAAFYDNMRRSGGMSVISPDQQARSKKAALRCTLYCFAATVLYSSILLMLLMRSPNRGQIVFALFGSFLIATLIAHQQFATQFSVVSWGSAMVTGVLFYVLAIASSPQAGANSWINVQMFARALPVDWMTVGGAGGVLGYWISERIHELRHIERITEEDSD
jgi:hypothetical protein